ncbi:MAG TPA: hypothetical protein VIG66_08425 [Noviherbaspirillum sp.]
MFIDPTMLRAAINKHGAGYYPYSSEDTFELLRCETTRFVVTRVPKEFVPSLLIFAAHSYVRAFGQPADEDWGYVTVRSGTSGDLENLVRQLDSTDSPESLKYKSVAMRGLEHLENLLIISGRDPCIELIVSETDDLFISLQWYTTG